MSKHNLILDEKKTISSVSEIETLGYCVGNGIVKHNYKRLCLLLELSPPQNVKTLSLKIPRKTSNL